MKQIFLFANLLFFCLAVPEKSKAQTWYLDRSFAENGIRSIDFSGSRDSPNTLVKTPDGKLLFSANGPTVNVGLFIKTAKLNPLCGISDSSYGNNGQTYFQLDAANYLNHIRVLPDGKILGSGMLAPPGGAMSATTPFFCRLKANGSLDSTFRGTGYFSERFDPISGGEYFDSHFYPDGKMLAIGKSYQNINGGLLGIGLTRFMPDGSLDTSFNGTGRKVLPLYAFGPAAGYVNPQSGSMYIFSQIEIGGSFKYPRIAKFNNRGQTVLNFGSNGVTGFGRYVYDEKFYIHPQGSKALIFYTVAGPPFTKTLAVRFDTTSGLADSSFGTNGEMVLLSSDPTNFYMQKVNQLPDGRFLLIGKRNVGNGVSALFCLKPDCSVDSSFGNNGKIEFDYPGFYGDYFADALLMNDSTLYILGQNPGGAEGDALLYKYSTNQNNWFFLGADRSICGNATQTLNAGFPGSSYLWNTGAGSQSISADTSGEYSIRIKEPGGCSAYDTIRITFNEIPPVPVISASSDSLICNASGNLQWYRNGQVLTNDTLAWIIPAQPGAFTVRVTTAAGCSSESLPYNLTSGQKLSGKLLGLQASPNPFNKEIAILLPGQTGENRDSLYNLLGLRLQTWNINGEKGVLNASEFLPGTYFLRHEDSGLSQRLIKH